MPQAIEYYTDFIRKLGHLMLQIQKKIHCEKYKSQSADLLSCLNKTAYFYLLEVY